MCACVRITDRPPSLILRPEVDFLSRLRPELIKVLSSSMGLVRGLPLAGLNSSGEEEQEWALRGSGRDVLAGEYGGGFPRGSPAARCKAEEEGFGESDPPVTEATRVRARKLGSGGKGKWEGGR